MKETWIASNRGEGEIWHLGRVKHLRGVLTGKAFRTYTVTACSGRQLGGPWGQTEREARPAVTDCCKRCLALADREAFEVEREQAEAASKLLVPPCVSCGCAIDFERGDQWVWLEGEEDPTRAVCDTCFDEAAAVPSVASDPLAESLSVGSFFFELRVMDGAPGGLESIVVVASNARDAFFTALGACRDSTDVLAWLGPENVHSFPLGPAFEKALQDANIMGGIVCAVYSAKEDAEA